MPASWWLAVAGLPVFMQPLPESPREPALVAVVAGRAALRAPCYGLVCADAEWVVGAPPRTLQRPVAPGTVVPVEGLPAPKIATARTPLNSPASRRAWHNSHADATRVDTRFGYEAVRTPETSVRVEMGTGYRIQPYADWGTAVEGPIARGSLQLRQDFGDHARLTQQVQVETGRANTMLRQVVGLDLALRPQWQLQTRYELRHDTLADGGAGATDSEGTMRLRYEF